MFIHSKTKKTRQAKLLGGSSMQPLPGWLQTGNISYFTQEATAWATAAATVLSSALGMT